MIPSALRLIDKKKQNNVFILSLLIFLLSFKAFEPDINIGLDGGYFCAINDFFAHDLSLFQHVIHSYGPLGFLKNPLDIGNNFLIGLITYSILLYLHIVLIFNLGLDRGKSLMALFFINLILAYLANLDYLIYGIITSSLLLFDRTNTKKLVAVALFLVAISFFIKVNIAINASLIFFSYIFYRLFETKFNPLYWKILIAFGIVFLFLWLIIYRTYSNLFLNAITWVSFSIGNADFSSLFPPNNLFLLFTSVLLFYLIPFIDKKSDIKLLYILFSLLFFATFKYSVARQENLHSKALLDLMIFFCLIFFIYIKDFKPIIVGVLFLMVTFYYQNLKINNTYHYDDRIKLIRTENLIDVCNYSHYSNYYAQLSNLHLEKRKLPDTILTRIKDSYVDFFPWDYNYIYANHLHYKPRPSLQTGALYTPLFLDKKNAEHVLKHPEVKYILWEKVTWNSEMGGIDDKYLLNGDGNYIYELISNYKIVTETPTLKLLERTVIPRLSRKIIATQNISWNEWIKVPSVNSGCIRATIESKKSLLRALKAAVYKTGGKYIEYKLSSGKIILHRFSEDAEETGLWISPYLKEISNDLQGEKVDFIRFNYSDTKFKMNEAIKINWEHLQFKN